MDLTTVVTLKQYAEKHKLDAGALRRYIRKNAPEWACKWGTGWAIDKNAKPPELVTGSRTTRTDNRHRYIVFLSDAERDALIVTLGDADLVECTRERARARRAARKLAENDMDA